MSKLFDEALAAEGVTGQLAELARSIFMQETTAGKNVKTSNAGAVGHMQVMPATFAEVADKGWDIKDPLQNMRAGIRYLGARYKQAGGDPALAAAGYYGGPGGLEKARKGIAVADPRNPKAPNTLQYGAQVAARLGTAPATQPVTAAVGAAPDSQPVIVPLQVPAMAAAGTPATTTALGAGENDPWQAFLSMAQGRVTPQDLDFAAAARSPGKSVMPALAAEMDALISRAAKPATINFGPFGGRKKT